jgi:hypothetical protein
MQQYVSTVIDISSSNSVVGTVRGLLTNVDVVKIPNITGTCLSVTGAVQLGITGCFFGGMGEGLIVPNTAFAPFLLIIGTVFYGTHDISILNANTTGTIQASAKIANVNIIATDISSSINGIDGDYSITGDIFQGNNLSQITNISVQLQKVAALGVINEYNLSSPSGTDITAVAGSGYLMNGIEPNDYLQYITWTDQTITLPVSNLSYVYVDNLSIVQSSTALPSIRTNIILGAAKTNASGITYLQATRSIAASPRSTRTWP